MWTNQSHQENYTWKWDTYTIDGEILKGNDLKRDLGIIIDKKVTFVQCMELILKKVKHLWGFAVRNLVNFRNEVTLKVL